MLVPTVQSRVQLNQGCQLLYFKASIDTLLSGLGWRSDGHLLVKYLPCYPAAPFKITHTFVVIFRTLFPGVVGQFVIIPNTNPWMRCMSGHGSR